jgi:hypothetical protein
MALNLATDESEQLDAAIQVTMADVQEPLPLTQDLDYRQIGAMAEEHNHAQPLATSGYVQNFDINPFLS